MDSPLLANIYLNRFDHWFAEQAMLGDGHARDANRKAGGANFMMVRYADDFAVFSNGTKMETEAFKVKMKDWLAEELKLELSEEKSTITHYTDGFDFLGFTFKKTTTRTGKRDRVVHFPSTSSVERAAQRVEALTDRKTLMHSPADQIEALNCFLRGWGEYFRHSSAKIALRYVGWRAFMRMWKWLNAKEEHRHGWREVYRKYHQDQTWMVDGHRLMVLQSMPIEYPKCKAIPNPYLGERLVLEPVHLDPFLTEWTGAEEYGAGWTSAREIALGASEGACVICGAPSVEIHHHKARRAGGGNVEANLTPLCRTHHRQVERRNSVVSHKLHEKTPDSGEPDAPKGARPVRGETL